MTAEAEDAMESIYVSEGHYGPFQVQVRSAASTFMVDESLGAGGISAGPNPFDLLSAALGSCALMTMRMFAFDRRWPLECVTVRVGHERPSLAERDRFLVEVQILGPLDGRQREELMRVASRCPIHLTLARGSDMEVRMLPEGPVDRTAVSRMTHLSRMKEATRI
jgi:putative redox protein